jgi:hypothetical protein
MSSYTITVVPNDDSGTQTTLVVDTASGQARVTDVHLRAPDGLAAGRIPAIDVGLLLQAVALGPSAVPAGSAATDSAPAAALTVDHRDSSSADRTESDEPTADTSPAAVPIPDVVDDVPAAVSEPGAVTRSRRSRRSGTATGVRGAAKKATPRRAGTAEKATKPASAASARKRAARTQEAAASTGRVYRRMPDDLLSVYERNSSPAAIAAHYEVPRHTAQGWVRRLRQSHPDAVAESSRDSRPRRG